jgi:hypothetical protein
MYWWYWWWFNNVMGGNLTDFCNSLPPNVGSLPPLNTECLNSTGMSDFDEVAFEGDWYVIAA